MRIRSWRVRDRLAARSTPRHDRHMGNGRIQATTPDLFSAAAEPEPAASSPKPSPAAAAPTRIVLPRDLPTAIKHLSDQELDRLSAAVIAEQQARGGGKTTVVEKSERKAKVEVAAASLSTGKLNAVRAAFKAGVKPAQIAKQFGISQSDVRKALASDGSKA